ncbi:MAG: phosphatase PAP2 family protein [Planctomycetes bacterium]|nr:phosphatase PAP2 family protein [Planctomycetota bacterium]
MPRGLGALALALLGAACSSSRPGPFDAAHWRGEPWSGALAQQGRHTNEWLPPTVLAGALPLALGFDSELQDDSRDQHYLTGGITLGGDVVSPAIGGFALAIGGVEWWQGDEGRFFEVAAESLLATTAATHAIKFATQRSRPDSPQTSDSFPSGHTSLATSGATLLARWVDERWDSSWGYLAFAPATYVALTRMEGNRHYASDVVAGAALGIFLTNWVFDAHYGDPQATDALYRPRERSFVALWPYTDGDALGLTLAITF